MRLLWFVLFIALLGMMFVYLRWVSVSTHSDSQKINTEITVNKDKVRSDLDEAKSKVGELGDSAKRGAKDRSGSPSGKTCRRSPRKLHRLRTAKPASDHTRNGDAESALARM